MNHDPVLTMVALVLMLVGGTVAAVVGALRADRRKTRSAGAARPPHSLPVREGEWSLVLDGAGAKKIQVVKELRALTGLGLAEAKRLTDRTPSMVLSGVDRATAIAARDALAEAGAAVRITDA